MSIFSAEYVRMLRERNLAQFFFSDPHQLTSHNLTYLHIFTDVLSYILWMEEILHQLVYGLSHCNPIIYSVL